MYAVRRVFKFLLISLLGVSFTLRQAQGSGRRATHYAIASVLHFISHSADALASHASRSVLAGVHKCTFRKKLFSLITFNGRIFVEYLFY